VVVLELLLAGKPRMLARQLLGIDSGCIGHIAESLRIENLLTGSFELAKEVMEA
jgi:hypothetical protein